ncbi:SPOR domain-containing protein [Hymenobacter sp. ASUV-10]|uniref:SPOR domain-containing protein n=1 Tax=Hymenobacter aranciens TaxID=3063996 RepID=A0ABT9B7H6_9BACT|nr:SPOR domain-containing protein [Hymenobacter sp. ASUV-10]MDO7873608.1 SPOR domain-containing protein [Hymenobacter sp. ASUV-10]
MHLADHIRPLLRDHDCVIIPDFGGLVADVAPARLQAGRQVLSPPTKLVAFNQALTRNDGLLIDAVSQHLDVSLSQARELVRQAVAQLRQELEEAHRTTLPGIGIFRRGTGRGLSFEYTGNDNLLPASYGLPELVARPVLTANAREKRPQPVLRSGAQRGRLARVLPGAALGVVAVLALTASLLAWNNNSLPTWAARLSNIEWSSPTAPAVATAPAVTMQEPQQATLAQHGWTNSAVAEPAPAPAELESVPPVILAETPATDVAPTPSPTVETLAAPAAITTPVAAPVAAKAEAVKPEPKAVEKEKAAAPVVKPAVAKPAAVTSTTIKSRTGRFYVVAGAFSTLASAQKVRANHPNGRVILPPWGSRLYRLSVADFADRASAEKEAARLRVKAHSTNSHLVFPY